MAVQERAAESLAQLVDTDPPESLVNDEMRRRIEDVVMRLQAQGMSVEQYLAFQGRDVASFTEEIRQMAAQGVKVDLALRAVAEAEAIEVDDDDVEAELARLAERSGQKAKDVRKAYERNDALGSLRSEIRKQKAMEWLVEHCEIVDPDGNPISREALNPMAFDDDSGEDGDRADNSDGEETGE